MVDFSGVAVVDITGFDLASSSSQTVTGLYEQCSTAYASGKAVLVEGWDYDGVEVSPMFVYLIPSTNAFIIDDKYSVSNADAVTRL